MNFSDSINEMLERIDMESYLDREGIDYRLRRGRSGEQLLLKNCPFCGGDKWKVYINADSGLGNCFSGSCTKRTFNKYSFIQGVTGLGARALKEHLQMIASEMGWRPPRKTVLAVQTDVADLELPESLPLPINGRNLAYLQNRGVSIDMCRYFHLRFCKDGYYGMRVIVPVFDIEGALVSFQGRDITGDAENKYLFPLGYASTGEHLYNAHNVQAANHVVVNEGVFDVIATKIALDADPDLRDTIPIGTFGMHLSDSQLDKFQILKKRGVNIVTIMWDGELPATRAAIEAGFKLIGMGLTVRVAMLPDGRDPGNSPPSVINDCFYRAVKLDRVSATSIILSRLKTNG